MPERTASTGGPGASASASGGLRHQQPLLRRTMALQLGRLARLGGAEGGEPVLERGERRLVVLRRLGERHAAVAQLSDVLRQRLRLAGKVRLLLAALLELLLQRFQLLLRRVAGARCGAGQEARQQHQQRQRGRGRGPKPWHARRRGAAATGRSSPRAG
jgi:hypothetical protein